MFQLIDRARSEGREIIAIAMGNAGIATRILGPSRGSFLTYGALDDESATAPGQVNARKLRSLYNIDTINDETMICGLVGLPVMHSVSPHIHNAAFAAEGINGVYLPFEVKDVNVILQTHGSSAHERAELEPARLEHHRATQTDRNGMP